MKIKSLPKPGNDTRTSTLLLPAEEKVRKWMKTNVKHGHVRLKKWTPEHQRQGVLKDLRPTKDLSDLRKLKKPKKRQSNNMLPHEQVGIL
jgi:hypothetical protein